MPLSPCIFDSCQRDPKWSPIVSSPGPSKKQDYLVFILPHLLTSQPSFPFLPLPTTLPLQPPTPILISPPINLIIRPRRNNPPTPPAPTPPRALHLAAQNLPLGPLVLPLGHARA